MEQLIINTIGHSTRSIDEFIGLLQTYGIRQVVDIRSVPRSRRNPQFNQELLPISLRKAGIAYQAVPALGGLRRTRPNSANTGWRNASFRGYADYMQTPEFEQGLEQLLGLARQSPTAIMCAEAVPWRCHRSLVADALVARGVQVQHILSQHRAQPHSLTPFAVLRGKHISYPEPGAPHVIQ